MVEGDEGRRARAAARELSREREEAAGELPFRLRQASRAVDRPRDPGGARAG